MNSTRLQPLFWALNNAPLVLFAAVLAVFGWLSPNFLSGDNLLNILLQASATAVVAIGMTFVLLTAGVDLSVGAIMFVAGAVAGKMALAGAPLLPALAIMLLIGLAYGALNAFCVTWLRIVAFMVTLATFYLGRGFSRWLTESQTLRLPESFLDPRDAFIFGFPLPVLVFGIVLVLAHLVLTRTPYGRQIYAVGNDLQAAQKAGINTRLILASVYVISGLCAAIGAVLTLVQLASVGPEFGSRKEFQAIAAAVLGGTSLFGGRGKVFPGTVLGAVLVQSVENGLNRINADPYLYLLITSAIIFVAVLTDSFRNALLAKLGRRKIRVEEASLAP